jgi:hypothetical protein
MWQRSPWPQPFRPPADVDRVSAGRFTDCCQSSACRPFSLLYHSGFASAKPVFLGCTVLSFDLAFPSRPAKKGAAHPASRPAGHRRRLPTRAHAQSPRPASDPRASTTLTPTDHAEVGTVPVCSGLLGRCPTASRVGPRIAGLQRGVGDGPGKIRRRAAKPQLRNP